MSRECEICGRTLKTGRKYCYAHRNIGREEGYSKSEDKAIVSFILFLIIVSLAVWVYWNIGKFAWNHWIFVMILCLIVLIIEGYRIKKLTIRGIDRKELWVISTALAIFLIILLNLFYLIKNRI